MLPLTTQTVARGQPAREVFKLNGQHVDTPALGVIGIAFFDEYVETAALQYPDRAARAGKPFFMARGARRHGTKVS